MFEDALDLAVLALAQAEREPEIVALDPVERGLDGAVLHPVDGHALLEPVEVGLGDVAEGAHPVAAQPAGIGVGDHLGEPAVVGEKQQPLGVDVEPADGDDPRQVVGEPVEHGRAPFRVTGGGDDAARLVQQPEPGALAGGQGLAVDRDAVGFGDVDRRRGQDLAVEGDAAGLDHRLGVAAGSDAGAGDGLGDALALGRGGLVRGRGRGGV